MRSTVVVAAAATLLLTAAPVSSANAAGSSCVPPASNFFDGFYDSPSDPTAWEGASAYLLTEAPAMCGSDTKPSNFSTAWSMIAGSNTFEWAQSGMMRIYLSTGELYVRHFAQAISEHTAAQTWFYGNVPTGVRHAYRSLYSSSCFCVQMQVDGVVKLATSFNPFGDWLAPFVPEFFGEVPYQASSDMPGIPTAHELFTGLGAQRYSDDVLVSMPCYLLGQNDNPSNWGRSASTCVNFDIWTY